MARLRGLMDVDAPSGELRHEHSPWDVARYRAQERRRGEAEESVFTVAAVDGRGRVVGHSDVEAYAERPPVAFQGSTIVEGDDRGHGLGMAMKRENLARFAVVWPDAERATGTEPEDSAASRRVDVADSSGSAEGPNPVCRPRRGWDMIGGPKTAGRGDPCPRAGDPSKVLPGGGDLRR